VGIEVKNQIMKIIPYEIKLENTGIFMHNDREKKKNQLRILKKKLKVLKKKM